jgi:hypothetical protein
MPDAVWRRFAEDSEEAIRRSAPREPSALERAAGLPADTGSGGGPALTGEPAQWVGESYPASLGQKAWRDMGERERWRYFTQALLVVIVMTAVLLTVSRGAPVPDTADSPAGDVVMQESEEGAEGPHVE